MNTFMAVGAQLLRTGDYSDFTLVCGGQEFRVHKNIVCSQSPVISAALKSGFKVIRRSCHQIRLRLDF